MKITTDDNKITGLIGRGVEEVIEKESLLKKLKSGRKLRIKHGIDPTGPRIHLGRAIQFRKLRVFQELGHQVVLIIGDFTAQIGDASDKDAMRRSLSEKEIKENMKDYEHQIGKILNMRKVELRHNSEWLKKMTAKDLLAISMQFTAQQLIQRRNFKERWDAGRPIGLHELDYPLFQGYDSMAIKADVEVGGTDQVFNMLTGRDIQPMFGQPSQDVMTLKMLNGLDGRKMSTSWGNIISIIDEPNDMYGKVMSMKDESIPEYFELCTDISFEELESVKKSQANPRDIKARLAKMIVKIYHGEELAQGAENEFNKVFSEKGLPTDIPEVEIKEKSLPILDLLVLSGATFSKSEAKRLILQGGVKINGEVQNDWQKVVEIKKGMVVRAGKRKFARIK